MKCRAQLLVSAENWNALPSPLELHATVARAKACQSWGRMRIKRVESYARAIARPHDDLTEADDKRVSLDIRDQTGRS